jgi:hypothetical protein
MKADGGKSGKKERRKETRSNYSKCGVFHKMKGFMVK